MNTLTTDEIATLDEPNTWCSSRLQIIWKIRLEAPDTKNAMKGASGTRLLFEHFAQARECARVQARRP